MRMDDMAFKVELTIKRITGEGLPHVLVENGYFMRVDAMVLKVELAIKGISGEKLPPV